MTEMLVAPYNKQLKSGWSYSSNTDEHGSTLITNIVYATEIKDYYIKLLLVLLKYL